MSFKNNVNAHLEQFGQNAKLGKLSLNEFNTCSLCFDETMVVNIEYLENSESLAFVATAVKLDRSDDVLVGLRSFMLDINLQHNNMIGAFLCHNEGASEALLVRSISASVDFIQFESVLEKFVNTLEWVVGELNSYEGGAANTQNESKPVVRNHLPGSYIKY